MTRLPASVESPLSQILPRSLTQQTIHVSLISIHVDWLHPLSRIQDAAPVNIDGGNDLHNKPRAAWLGKLRKSKSTYNIDPEKGMTRLSRRASMTTFSNKHGGDSLNGIDLETLARLGGVNVFKLPPPFSPLPELILPVCISATAQCLDRVGKVPCML